MARTAGSSGRRSRPCQNGSETGAAGTELMGESRLDRKTSQEGSTSDPNREIGTGTRFLATGFERPGDPTQVLPCLKTRQQPSSALLLSPYDQARLSSRALFAYSMKSACG